MSDTMTNPPQPIHVCGEAYAEWRGVGTPPRRNTVLQVTMTDDWASAMMGQLGQYVPGILEDGTAVEFYVVSVRWIGPNKHEVQLMPEMRAKGDVL